MCVCCTIKTDNIYNTRRLNFDSGRRIPYIYTNFSNPNLCLEASSTAELEYN